MNWMWPWQETVAVVNDTFETVLRLMAEFSDLCFSQSQASVYAMVERYHPELLEEIRRYVSAGRWELTASHWVENDKNLVDGESLCRHLLYTRRYLRKMFGAAADSVAIDWACDTFGHAATVPAYLVRGGIKYVYLHRPGAHHPARPPAFWWEAPDGSRVLVRNDLWAGYNGQLASDALLKHLVAFVRETHMPALMYVFGVGDHGGGPTRRDIVRAIAMNSWPVFPRVVFSPARSFFERLEQQTTHLPVLRTELNCEFTGCYTAQTVIKRANRQAENRLADTECITALCTAAFGRAYPSKALEEAWQDTLFSQFHDILGGSCTADARVYSQALFQRVMATTSIEQTKALRFLAKQVDTAAASSERGEATSASSSTLGAGAGYGTATGSASQSAPRSSCGLWPLLVFNPTATVRTEIVEATLWSDGRSWNAGPGQPRGGFTVTAPDGRTIPAQIVESGQYWGHPFVRLAFPVSLPELGYSVLIVREEKLLNPPPPGVWHIGFGHYCSYSFYERSPEGLENDLVRLEVDPNSGGIRTLFHKPSGLRLVASEPAPALLEYVVERPHHMSAWLIDHTGTPQMPEVLKIQRKLAGPYRASLEVNLRVQHSELTLSYELRSGDPNLYLHLRAAWFERGSPAIGVPALRLVLRLALSTARICHEIPFGSVERKLLLGEESPALGWVRVTGLSGGKRGGLL
ncbi:MAG: glycoside hydrolase family 38 C-terminal domain-containing protein, partial [Kiritimatiellia bacterium]